MGGGPRLGIVTPVPDAVHRMGTEAIVEHEIEMYVKPAPRVGFWLTGKEHRYPNSITTMELQRHMEDPELLKKTQFYMNPKALKWTKEELLTPGVVHIPGYGREIVPPNWAQRLE